MLASYTGQDLQQFMKREYNALVKQINTQSLPKFTDNLFVANVTCPLNKDVIISHNLGKTIWMAQLFSIDSSGFLVNNSSFTLKYLFKDGNINKDSVLIYNTNAGLVGPHIVTLIGA